MHSPSVSSFDSPTATLADWLREQLTVPSDGIRRVTFEAPRISTLEWLDACPELSFVWQSGTGPLHLGFGAALEWTASGPGRFDSIRDGVARALTRMTALAAPGIPSAPARVFGGFSFRPEARDGSWSSFGAAHFVCPRLHYVSGPSGATLTITFDPARTEDTAERVIAQAVALIATVRTHSHHGAAFAPGRAAPIRADEFAATEWEELVAGALRELATGETAKLVVARASQREFQDPIWLGATLSELGRAYPDCTKFAFRFGGPTFVGASPERLIEKSGTDISTEALAGSAAGGSAGAAHGLLASEKERVEHAPVLEAILAALAPLCTEIQAPTEPSVRELGDLLHLRTPIRGSLRGAVHVLDLVRCLHPTPAVGGMPTVRALDWLTEHEPLERGWYAGPLGWFDRAGDGQFDVALRAGLISERTVTLYAGAGIVADSVAEQEYEETRLKLSALARSLRTRAE